MTTATQVRERPILFSAPMVRAILDGSKTQTRRVVKPQPEAGPRGRMEDLGGAWGLLDGDLSGEWRCPYGAPGDRLWVREAWRALNRFNSYPVEVGSWIGYEADNPDHSRPKRWGRHGRVRPSIHMPRWASRITLEITDVRVGRVQEICEEDANREGVDAPRCPRCCYTRWDCAFHMDHSLCGEPYPASAVPVFRRLWDQINGPRGFGWDANPWVWVLGFRRLEP